MEYIREEYYQDYKIIGDFESVENSSWKEEENLVALEFMKYHLRPAIEKMKDSKEPPRLFVTVDMDNLSYQHLTPKWWKTRKDEDSEEREIPRGTRMQGVMCSRFGDIGFTLDLGPEASGYIIRLDPFSSNLKDIRNTP